MFDPVIVSVIEQTKAALLQTNPQLAKDLERRRDRSCAPSSRRAATS